MLEGVNIKEIEKQGMVYGLNRKTKNLFRLNFECSENKWATHKLYVFLVKTMEWDPSVLNGYICALDCVFVKLMTLKSTFWHYFKLASVIRLFSQLWVAYQAMDYLAIHTETHLKSIFESLK